MIKGNSYRVLPPRPRSQSVPSITSPFLAQQSQVHLNFDHPPAYAPFAYAPPAYAPPPLVYNSPVIERAEEEAEINVVVPIARDEVEFNVAVPIVAEEQAVQQENVGISCWHRPSFQKELLVGTLVLGMSTGAIAGAFIGNSMNTHDNFAGPVFSLVGMISGALSFPAITMAGYKCIFRYRANQAVDA